MPVNKHLILSCLLHRSNEGKIDLTTWQKKKLQKKTHSKDIGTKRKVSQELQRSSNVQCYHRLSLTYANRSTYHKHPTIQSSNHPTLVVGVKPTKTSSNQVQSVLSNGQEAPGHVMGNSHEQQPIILGERSFERTWFGCKGNHWNLGDIFPHLFIPVC